MFFSGNSKLFENVFTQFRFGPMVLPYDYTGGKDEYLASRRSAWLGASLSLSPTYDVIGKDAIAFLNATCTNRDFGRTPVGGSKHCLICNEKGQMLADGVAMRMEENRWRTYWLAPVLEFFLLKSNLEVEGKWITDEFLYQLDGPKSLEILEEVMQADIHDLKFGKNQKMVIAGRNVLVHRLGMSGALAYEIHGQAADADAVYESIYTVLKKYDGRQLGFRNYSALNHTPAGYPNQDIHYLYPCYTSGDDLKAFVTSDHVMQMGCAPWFMTNGSASDHPENAFMTPYDVGWGNLVNFDHEFPGKAALKELKENSPYTMVTLEWNAEDVGKVYAAQFDGTSDVVDPIEHYSVAVERSQMGTLRIDYVMKNGERVGIASGKVNAYYEHRILSLAKIKKDYAHAGEEVIVLWGTPGTKQIEIRATVAKFPYYDGEYRNETCDVMTLIPARPYLNK